MRVLALVALGAVVTLMLMAAPAFAEANPHASCNGLGGSTESRLYGPGARADVSHEVITVFAVEQGTTPGNIFSAFAQEHAGSALTCFG